MPDCTIQGFAVCIIINISLSHSLNDKTLTTWLSLFIHNHTASPCSVERQVRG